MLIYTPNHSSVQCIQPWPKNPKHTVILTLFASECPLIPLPGNNEEEKELDF